MSDWEDAKKELLKNPERRRAYEKFDWRYELSKKWTDLKIWWAKRRGKL